MRIVALVGVGAVVVICGVVWFGILFTVVIGLWFYDVWVWGNVGC